MFGVVNGKKKKYAAELEKKEKKTNMYEKT